MTCNGCRSYQATFICPECQKFNEHILAYQQYQPPPINPPQQVQPLPETGATYQANKQLLKVLREFQQPRVFQTFVDVDYKQFSELDNLKILIDGEYDVIVLCNGTFKLPIQAFGLMKCKYLVLRSYECSSYQLIANMLTFTATIQNIILDFGSSNLGVLSANYQLLVQSICGFEQTGLILNDLPPEFLIYYQNKQQPAPKARVISPLTLQQLMLFQNYDFQKQKLIFAALTPASNFLTQLTQIKINICRSLSLSGFLGIKLCSLQNDLPSIYPFLLHLNHLILGLPNIQSVELFSERNHYFLPVVQFEIYDEAVKLKLIQQQKRFLLEPRMDFILTDNPRDQISQNQNIFMEMFNQRQIKPEQPQNDYVSVLQGYNYDYYSMGDEQLCIADLKLAQELVTDQCGIFTKIMPPRTVLSLIRRSSRNPWFYLLMFSERGLCDGVLQFFQQEKHNESDLLDYLSQQNQIPRNITFVLLFDYYRKEQIGANQTLAITQMKPDILNAAFYPHYQDLQMVKFCRGQNLILQGFPEYAQLFTANMQMEIDFLLACVEPAHVVTDCPLICYFRMLLSGQWPTCVPLGLSDELFLPMLCQFHYLYPSCAPTHLDLHAEYKIRFHQSSFQTNFSKNKFAQTQIIKNRSFCDESTAYDNSARIQLFFDMFPSIKSLRIINASGLLTKPQETARLILQLALRCDSIAFVGLEISAFFDHLLNGEIHTVGKYVRRQIQLAARLQQLVRENHEALEQAEGSVARRLLALQSCENVVIERISDRHVFHGGLEAQQFQELLQSLDELLKCTHADIIEMPSALFAPRATDTAIANLVSLVHLFIAHGVRILRGSFLGNPRAAFLTTVMQCCLGLRSCVQNIGFVNYKASFQILRCEADRLAGSVKSLVFQQFQQSDILCDFADDIVEICSRFQLLEHLFFIENGLSTEKQANFQAMLTDIATKCPNMKKATVIEPNFDKKSLRDSLPQLQFAFMGDLAVRNGVVLKRYEGVDDIFDILQLDEEVRLIDSLC